MQIRKKLKSVKTVMTRIERNWQWWKWTQINGSSMKSHNRGIRTIWLWNQPRKRI